MVALKLLCMFFHRKLRKYNWTGHGFKQGCTICPWLLLNFGPQKNKRKQPVHPCGSRTGKSLLPSHGSSPQGAARLGWLPGGAVGARPWSRRDRASEFFLLALEIFTSVKSSVAPVHMITATDCTTLSTWYEGRVQTGLDTPGSKHVEAFGYCLTKKVGLGKSFISFCCFKELLLPLMKRNCRPAALPEEKWLALLFTFQCSWNTHEDSTLPSSILKFG